MRAKLPPSVQFFHLLLAVAFVFNMISPSLAQEVDLKLPKPSQIKPISKVYSPAMIRAVTVNPNDPFLFDFIIDKGDSNLSAQAFEEETQKLVKYFLAALTIPENDLWVNLSPYEQDLVVSQVLGVTELGKDLLIQDYYLKQVTAALTNPNTETGKKFWSLAYAKAKELYGNADVPINTFSKVWIVPDQAVVLEKDGSAFIADSHLKVYLDQDYTAIRKNLDNAEIGTDKLGNDQAQDINNFSAQIIKEVVLPEIEKEVNTGENFASVRQIYNSAILAAWYKKRLKESLLGKLYADQNKVAGVNAQDMQSGDKIFEKYTAALKTGAYNIVKQDYDLSTQKIVQRKYFSGGANFKDIVATTNFITLPASGAMNTSTIAALPAAAQLNMTEIARSISSIGQSSPPRIGQSGVPTSSSSNIVVASFSLRPSSSSTVAAVARTLTPALASAPTTVVLTAKDESIIRGLGNISTGQIDTLYAQADQPQNRADVIAAKQAVSEAKSAGRTVQQIANIPQVQKVVALSLNNPAVAVSLRSHDAPEVPALMALAQSTRNSDGSFNKEKFNNYVTNYNRSIGVTSISASQQKSLQEAVVATQAALTTPAGKESPLTAMAASVQNPEVQTGLNILSTHSDFAAQMQLNAGVAASNTAVTEYVSTVETLKTLSPQLVEAIGTFAKVSDSDRSAIAAEITKPNFATLSPVQALKEAPVLTRVVDTNPDFKFAVFAQSAAQTNPPQLITALSTNDYFNALRIMPDAQLQRQVESFLKSQGQSADQAQQQAKKLVETFSSLRNNDTSRGYLNNVATLKLAAGRTNDTQRAADINALANTLQGIEQANALAAVTGDFKPFTVADQQIRQAAGFSREEFVTRVRSNAPGITSEKANLTFDALQQVITSQPQAFKSSADFGKAIHAATVATPNSTNTARENLQIIALASTQNTSASSTVTPVQNILASVSGVDARVAIPPSHPLVTYFTAIAKDSKINPVALTRTIAAASNAARENPDFAIVLASAKNAEQFKTVIQEFAYQNPTFSALATKEGMESLNQLNDNQLRQVGGIDLSADRMDLKIKRDGKGVVLPIADQDLQNLRIDGLTPVLLNVAPATPASVPFLMNLGNAAQAK